MLMNKLCTAEYNALGIRTFRAWYYHLSPARKIGILDLTNYSHFTQWPRFHAGYLLVCISRTIWLKFSKLTIKFKLNKQIHSEKSENNLHMSLSNEKKQT
jgi:hypothetical protein